MLPLCARPGGVLERRGHTETAVDLAVLAGLPPVAVTCEVLAEDGSPARSQYLREFASDHRIAMVSVDAGGGVPLGERRGDAAAAPSPPCSSRPRQVRC